MTHMKRKLMALAVGLTMLGAAPMSALADDTTPKSYDGRLDDYIKPVTLDNRGTGLTYFLWAALGALALAVMFKDAKRSHLD
jgi:hypothetical protein